ncbi:MAG: putative endopeptidase [Candidatus Azotimanducaceae bacterium]
MYSCRTIISKATRKMVMNKLLILPIVFLLSSCGGEVNKPIEQTPQETPKASPVFGSFGVDLTARDEATKPGDNFFRFSNGSWLDSHEIAPERSSIGMGLIVHERAQERVKEIIEELGARSGAKGTAEQKVGDYYASWMDTETLNKLGISPLKEDLDRIASIRDRKALTKEFGMSAYISGIRPIYVGLGIDPIDPDKYNMSVGLSGLGLPERDYYLEDTERFVNIRAEYKKHIGQMLGFAELADTSESIFELEKTIAGHQWPRADRRDRTKTYNPMTVAQLKAKYPNYDWDLFLESSGVIGLTDINVSHPNTIEPLIELINTVSLDTWKAYLSYHMISNNAALLSEEIDSANFDFWGKIIQGSEQQLDRWKRGVSRVGGKTGLGEALGQIYVKRHFHESSKSKMLDLVENVRNAYEQRIANITWMGDETKVEAQAKLKAFGAKIGYPNHWLDLSDISIEKAKLFGNSRRIDNFFEDFDAARLSRPTDRTEWFMMPQTVNAYYLSNFNEIVFPAAILEAPYFDPNADDAVNYGAIGSIIGHEMGHGFDDQGSKSDAKGIRRNWWTDKDREAFESLTKRLGEQYNTYEALPGSFVDGEFTMGENIGDLGGVAVAYRAYQLSLDGKEAPVIDGISGDQRFFLAYAQSWRSKARDERVLQLLKSDPHSPAKFRVNGIVRNIDEWYEAFNVGPENDLYLAPTDRVNIW